MWRKLNDPLRGNRRQTEMVVRKKSLVHAIAMLTWVEVEIERGRRCMILVNESQNDNEMTKELDLEVSQRCRSSRRTSVDEERRTCW